MGTSGFFTRILVIVVSVGSLGLFAALPCWQGNTSTTDAAHLLYVAREYASENSQGEPNYIDYLARLRAGEPETIARVTKQTADHAVVVFTMDDKLNSSTNPREFVAVRLKRSDHGEWEGYTFVKTNSLSVLSAL